MVVLKVINVVLKFAIVPTFTMVSEHRHKTAVIDYPILTRKNVCRKMISVTGSIIENDKRLSKSEAPIGTAA